MGWNVSFNLFVICPRAQAKGVVVLIHKKAVIGLIGLILLVCSCFAYSFGIQVYVRYHIRGWLFPEFGLIHKGYAVMCMPASVLTIVGLALYVAGKRELKKRPIKHPNRITSFACTILGAVLFVCSFHAFMGGFMTAGYMSGASLIYRLNITSPLFLLSALWTISGFILVADSVRDLS